MKKIQLIILFISSLCTGQVGINTSTPHSSAILDVNANDKGILIPTYNLNILDSNINPIENPAQGLLIYNNGTIYPKGMYYWTGSEWSKLHTKGDFNEILSLRINMYNNVDYPLVHSTLADKNIKNYEIIANTISGETLASVDSANGDITLPKGIYTIHVKLDGVIKNKTDWWNKAYYKGSKGNSAYQNIGINAVFQDDSNQNITEIQYGNQLLQLDGLFGYEYNFILNLQEDVNKVQLKLFYDTLSNTLITEENAFSYPMTPQQSGLKLNFNRIQ